MKINLLTSNLGKLKEFKHILGDDIEIAHFSDEYHEIQSNDPVEIAEESAKRMAEKHKMAVVVEDSGLFISALNGFPGTLSKYVHEKIGLKGLLTLLEDHSDRSATYRSVVCLCEPGKDPISFVGEEEGTISFEEKGTHGFGHDPIFIPEDSDGRTLAEHKNCEDVKKFRRRAVLKLKEYLVNTRS